MIKLSKKVLFIIALLFFAIICLRLIIAPRSNRQSISQAAFLRALDTGQIQRVSICMGYTLADLKITGKDSSSWDLYDISTKDLPPLIKKMMDGGVAVEFASARKSDSGEFVLDLVPFVLLVFAVGYIYFLQARKKT